eukprot:GHVL01022413.1.p1 GENE.GHVL01022413.1~~GHVL01022413.1.p1  ORF type:complete len:205 (+),score=57.03 GHVL01022413.1:586-1200(+)
MSSYYFFNPTTKEKCWSIPKGCEIDLKNIPAPPILDNQSETVAQINDVSSTTPPISDESSTRPPISVESSTRANVAQTIDDLPSMSADKIKFKKEKAADLNIKIEKINSMKPTVEPMIGEWESVELSDSKFNDCVSLTKTNEELKEEILRGLNEIDALRIETEFDETLNEDDLLEKPPILNGIVGSWGGQVKAESQVKAEGKSV